MRNNERVSIFGLILNSILFVAKLFVGLISNSVALISDALDALGDIIASIGILFAVKTGNKPADTNHPFGHHSAEPLAAFIVALITAILGFQVILFGFHRLINPETTYISLIVFVVVIFSLIIKSLMFIFFSKQGVKCNSPAIIALSIDSRNDIFRSLVVLCGVFSTFIGILWVESIVAIALGVGLLYSAYSLGKPNVDMLMGRAPSKEFLSKIRNIAISFPDVKKVGDIRAHYTGNTVEFEIVVMMSPLMTVKKSHGIAVKLRDELESLPEVNRVFVHVDPMKYNSKNKSKQSL